MVDLERMNPLKIKIDKEWGQSTLVIENTSGSELSLHSIQQAAVIPMIRAFAEYWSLVGLPLVGPQSSIARQQSGQGSGPGRSRIHIPMTGWRNAGVDIQISGRCAVAFVDRRRLRCGVCYHPGRLGPIGLDSGGVVQPRKHPLSIPIQRNGGGIEPGIIRVVVNVVLVQGHQATVGLTCVYRGGQPGVTSPRFIRRVMLGQRIIVSGVLPDVDNPDAIGNSVITQLNQSLLYLLKVRSPYIQYHPA